MNINKHGVIKKEDLNTEEFKCEQCGCEFTADYDEYYIEKGTCFTTSSVLTHTYSSTVTDTYICSCPECHKVVAKTKTRIESSQVTLSGTASSSIPDACKNCSNHPSNGGSGNCNCMLGIMGQVTCKNGSETT